MSLERFIAEYLPRAAAGEFGELALLGNQASYSFYRERYLFQLLAESGRLRRVFIPEHGLFSELQDQAPLDHTDSYRALAGAEFISLYGSEESSLYMERRHLEDINTIIVDLQDIGSRYYTFATTLSYLFDALAKHELELQLIVIERSNPAGRYVEGTALGAEYESFVGRRGLPHRHGLTLGELARFYQRQAAGGQATGNCQLEVVYDPDCDYFSKERGLQGAWQSWAINPSPNIPTPLTALVYSGQCLLEGTNLSEGRGTTRPFEIFGAPYLLPFPSMSEAMSEAKSEARSEAMSEGNCERGNSQKYAPPPQRGAILRPLRFLPTFHKWANKICGGYQIHIDSSGYRDGYHSLSHSLKLLRWVREHAGERFAWREGIYEFCSDRPAIEILAGDPYLLDYLEGRETFAAVRRRLEQEERRWIEEASALLLHPEPLKRVELDAKQDY